MPLTRQIGLLVLVPAVLHVAFNLLLVEMIEPDRCVPGGSVSVRIRTQQSFLGGYFRAGEGTFQCLNIPEAKWDSLALPWKFYQKGAGYDDKIYLRSSEPARQKAEFSAEARIPNIEISRRTVVKGRIEFAGGFAPKLDAKVGLASFEDTWVTATSERVKIVLYPQSMAWYIRQTDWATLSVFVIVLGGYLIAYKPKRRRLPKGGAKGGAGGHISN